MIVECAARGDPLFPHMESCRCGAENPSFVPDGAPRRDLTTDRGIERGVLILGAVGLGAAVMALLSPERFPEGWSPAIATLCVVSGMGFLIAYHRVDAATMERSRKAVLRATLY